MSLRDPFLHRGPRWAAWARQGFSTVEITVVVFLVGLFAASAVAVFSHVEDAGNEQSAVMRLSSMQLALGERQTVSGVGDLPDDLTGLKVSGATVLRGNEDASAREISAGHLYDPRTGVTETVVVATTETGAPCTLPKTGVNAPDRQSDTTCCLVLVHSAGQDLWGIAAKPEGGCRAYNAGIAQDRALMTTSAQAPGSFTMQ